MAATLPDLVPGTREIPLDVRSVPGIVPPLPIPSITPIGRMPQTLRATCQERSPQPAVALGSPQMTVYDKLRLIYAHAHAKTSEVVRIQPWEPPNPQVMNSAMSHIAFMVCRTS